MYHLRTEMVDRINFEEFQRQSAWEAIAGYTKEQLANNQNLDGFIATHWEGACDEIVSQVDDIEEAYEIFVSVWRQEFGMVSEASHDDEDVI